MTVNGPSTRAGGPGSSTAAWTHLPALDGLRGLAVIGVLLFHAGHLSGGFLGVDAFFALSGFLITSLLVREADSTGGVDLIGFWGRRFRRLLPAVVVLLVVTMVWARWFGTAAEWSGVRQDGPWAQAYLANWHQISSSSGYWESFAAPPLLNHLWSLAIEEQFYVLWPLVVAAVWRLGRMPHRTLLAVCLVGSAASLASMLALYDGGDPTRVYMGTDTRASSILVGAAAATAPATALWRWMANRLGNALDVVLAVAAVAMGAMWFMVDGASSPGLFRGGLLIHSLLAALLVALSAQVTPGGRRGVVTLFSWRPLVQVGAWSYSLYLWHWPVYAVLSPGRTGWDGWALTACRLGVSTLLAVLSYQFVEQRVRYRAAWARNGAGRISFAASMAGLAVFWAATPLPRTEIAEVDPDSIVVVTTSTSTTTPATTVTIPIGSGGSVSPTSTAVATTVTTTTSPPWEPVRTATWHGDSIAYDAAPAVLAALGASGLTADTLAYPGVRLTQYDDGRAPLTFIVERLEQEPPDVLIHQLSVWDAGKPVDEQREALVALDDVLVEAGTALILVTAPVQTPELEDPRMPTLVESARWLAARDPGRIAVLDQLPVFGAVYARDVNGDGIPERKPDGVHLCPSGAARFAAWLAGELAVLDPGLRPAEPAAWVSGAWSKDDRYDDPAGACSAL